MSTAKHRKSSDIEKESINKKRKLAHRKNMWDRLKWRKIDTSSCNLDDGKQGGEDTGEVSMCIWFILFSMFYAVNLIVGCSLRIGRNFRRSVYANKGIK